MKHQSCQCRTRFLDWQSAIIAIWDAELAGGEQCRCGQESRRGKTAVSSSMGSTHVHIDQPRRAHRSAQVQSARAPARRRALSWREKLRLLNHSRVLHIMRSRVQSVVPSSRGADVCVPRHACVFSPTPAAWQCIRCKVSTGVFARLLQPCHARDVARSGFEPQASPARPRAGASSSRSSMMRRTREARRAWVTSQSPETRSCRTRCLPSGADQTWSSASARDVRGASWELLRDARATVRRVGSRTPKACHAHDVGYGNCRAHAMLTGIPCLEAHTMRMSTSSCA